MPSSEEISVRLKPVLGLQPGAYLTFLYALILLAVLFFLFFYPGLRSRGTYVRFQTLPPGAAVRVDGRYAGSTPCELLIKGGERRITLSKPFYREVELRERFPGRIFATLFVRPARSYTVELSLQDSEGLFRHILQELAANPHLPDLLLEVPWSVYKQQDPEIYRKLAAFFDRAKYFITGPAQLYGLVSSLTGSMASARFLTPRSLIRTVEYAARVQDSSVNFPLWLASVLPETLARRVSQTSWYDQSLREYAALYGARFGVSSRPPGPLLAGSTRRVLGIGFLPVPAGTLVQGRDDESGFSLPLAHPVPIQSFYLSETEISKAQFKVFLQENPRWRKSNLQSLVAAGLVSDTYLADWTGDEIPAGEENLPAVNVSYHAAQAFCAWLGSKLSGFPAGATARLPFESEWEWAARGGLAGQPYPTGRDPGNACFYQDQIQGPRRVGSSSANGYGLRDMTGNVWEWCLDWYSPEAYFFSSRKAAGNAADSRQAIPYGAEKVVRGGSWANEKELVKLYVRGSQPPDWCTPFLGFRVLVSLSPLGGLSP